MKVIKLFKRDLDLGIRKRMLFFIFPMIVAAIQTPQIHELIVSLNDRFIVSGNGTVMDYYLYCMKGMEIYIFNPKETFLVPIHWFLLQIFAAYIVAYYAHDDYHSCGRNIFLACRDKSSWWISKCLWCACTVIVYYASFFFAVYVTSTYYGAKPSLSYSKQVAPAILGNRILKMSSKDTIMVAIVVPIVVMIGVSMLQMFLSFILTPIMSFAIVACIYVISAYYTKWYFVGSYSMIQRSVFFADDGMVAMTGLLLGVTMIFAACSYGKAYFEERDLI